MDGREAVQMQLSALTEEHAAQLEAFSERTEAERRRLEVLLEQATERCSEIEVKYRLLEVES